MSITLGSNIASLRGQRQLARTSSELATVFERLSSGQRINKASDDAAGLAIADALRADAKIFGVAVRNLNDGLSLLNVADAALESQSGILVRLKELAAQSANGVYTSKQREAVSGEYDSLVQEFGRIGETAEFNGLLPLREEAKHKGTSISFQAGLGAEETSTIGVTLPDSGTLSGLIDVRGDLSGDNLFNATDILVVRDNATSIEEWYQNIGSSLIRRRLTGSDGLEHDVYIGFIKTRFGVFAVEDSLFFFALEFDSEGNRTDMSNPIPTVIDGDTTGGDLSQEIDTDILLSISGVTVHLNLDLTHIQFRKTESPDYSVETNALEFSGVEYRARALNALEVIENRLIDISAKRGRIGATQSRLGVALNNLTVAQENFKAAESRIRDADIAEEASKLTRLSILQQAGAAILAQANQQPALALQLIG